MPMTIPQTLQDALGEKAAQDLANWIDRVLKERTVVRDEDREVLSRLDLLEHDVAGVKDDVQQLRTELKDDMQQLRTELKDDVQQLRTELKDDIHQLRTEMNERFDRINERFDRMNERFDTLYDRMLVQTRWTVGTIALFGTAVTILLAIAQFKP